MRLRREEMMTAVVICGLLSLLFSIASRSWGHAKGPRMARAFYGGSFPSYFEYGRFEELIPNLAINIFAVFC